MNKLLAGLLLTGAAVAAGVAVSKMLNKKEDLDDYDFDDDDFDYPDPFDTDESIDLEINDNSAPVEEAEEAEEEEAEAAEEETEESLEELEEQASRIHHPVTSDDF